MNSLRELRYGPLSVPSASVHTLSRILEDFPLLEMNDSNDSFPQHDPQARVTTSKQIPKSEAEKIQRLRGARKLVMSIQHLLFQQDPLQNASHRGDLSRVKLLLGIGANVNAVCSNTNYRTALCAAASTGHIAVAKLLLENGANVHHHSPMILAILFDHLAMIEFLVQEGADVNTQSLKTPGRKHSKQGDTALIVASRLGGLSAVELFIEKGADINARGADVNPFNPFNIRTDSSTAIQAAAKGNQVSIFKLLLEKGADINTLLEKGVDGNNNHFLETFFLNNQAKKGQTMQSDKDYLASIELLASEKNLNNKAFCTFVLLAASASGCLITITLFLDRGVDVNSEDANGDNALHRASRNGHLPIVQMLLERGALVNAINYARNASGRHQYRTALHGALDGDHIDIVKLLLEKGADANAQDIASGTEPPLLRVLKDEHLSVAKVIIAHQVDPNDARDAASFSVLPVASEREHLGVVKPFVDMGANVKIHTPGTDPLLHRALQEKHISLLKLLLEKGADAGARGADSVSALHLASKRHNNDIIGLLIEKGADINAQDASKATILHHASEDGHIDIVQLVCGKGADVNCVDEKSETPLHKASRRGHLAVVKELITRKANINAETANFTTPLHEASRGGYLAIAKLLLTNGANVNALDVVDPQSSPLCLAAAGGYFSLVRLLLESGANLTLGTETPLATARRHANNAIVQLLISNGAEQ